jgi:hypothetical protein
MAYFPHFLIQGGSTVQYWNKIRVPLFNDINLQLQDPKNNFKASFWLLGIYSSIVYARLHNSLAQTDLSEVEEKLAKAINLVFSIRAFDENANSLVPALTLFIPNILIDDETVNPYPAEDCLLMDSTLYMCVDEDLAPLFRSPNVSLLVDQLFWRSLRGPTKYDIMNYPR